METVQGNLDGTQVEQPKMYAIDATKVRNVEEVGMLLNALGLAMTKEYAEANNLTHLLIEE